MIEKHLCENECIPDIGTIRHDLTLVFIKC